MTNTSVTLEETGIAGAINDGGPGATEDMVISL